MYCQLTNLLSLIRHSRQLPLTHCRLYSFSEVDIDEISEPENNSYSDRLLHGHRIPVAKITGLNCNLLPETLTLTDQQKGLLANELETLLLFYHFHLDFPPDFPPHLRYPFILKLWNESHVPVPFGVNRIEFCEYNLATCPFPGYCNICTKK